MAKASKAKAAPAEETAEDRELKHWQDHLTNLGVDLDQPHQYSETLALLKQRAEDSHKPAPAE